MKVDIWTVEISRSPPCYYTGIFCHLFVIGSYSTLFSNATLVTGEQLKVDT